MKSINYSLPVLSCIIKSNFLYVDKTEYIYKLINRKPQGYYFLSRPRRFGKSLTLTTLESLFQGEKKLFKGLAIYDKYNWKKTYPVIHLDLGRASSDDPYMLKKNLSDEIDSNATWVDDRFPPIEEYDPEARFERMINISSEFGQVVILIDEYDSPILDQIGKPDMSGIINVMRKFYRTLERCRDKISFVYITGISKFCYDQIFADVPSLEDISLDPEFATIMGYTQKELEDNFSEYIDTACNHIPMERQEFLAKLQKCYARYRFLKDAEMVYNPVEIASLFMYHDYHFIH